MGERTVEEQKYDYYHPDFKETVGFKRVFIEYKEDVDYIQLTDNIRSAGANLINDLEDNKNFWGADPRLTALAQTAIEEAVMWAIKAINK